MNDSWVKNTYEPTLLAGKSASGIIDSVKVSRDALDKLGNTGWGTEAKATAASVLSGLGIASDKVGMYASNSQIFQNTAMNRVNTVLNAAAGPQTEGDAQRAQKTFASLANTPKANQFILDLTEAIAQRDQLKSRFYQEAQSIAKAKGDLTLVDPEWTKRAPSVFNLGPMKKWGIE